MARRVFGDHGRSRRRTPPCTGPIAVRDPAAAGADADNLRSALARLKSEEGCGFGTWVGQSAVDPDVVWAKLAAMAEGARLASREFW
jgi:hypothetical protein